MVDEAAPATPAQPERTEFSRRGFIVGAAGLTGVALSGVWRETAARADEASSATAAPGFVFLEINGAVVGSVRSFQGGNPVAEVAAEEPGPDGIAHKHISGVKYGDITLELGLSMGKPIYDWIEGVIENKSPVLSGALITTDSDFKARRRLDFKNARMTEIGFPACDGASKDAAFLTVKIAPELTSSSRGSGTVKHRPSNQKNWLPANFRISVGGLPTSNVSKIDSFVIKQSVADGAALAEPGKVEFPNIKITLSDSKAWHDWFDDFVIKGNNGDESEVSGRLEVLSPNRSRVLAALDFGHMGIVSLAPDRPEPSSVRRLQAEMYCETMTFQRGSG